MKIRLVYEIETLNVVVSLEGIAAIEWQLAAFSESGDGELWCSTVLSNCTVHVKKWDHEKINNAMNLGN